MPDDVLEAQGRTRQAVLETRSPVRVLQPATWLAALRATGTGLAVVGAPSVESNPRADRPAGFAFECGIVGVIPIATGYAPARSGSNPDRP